MLEMRPPTDAEVELIGKEATWARINPTSWAPGQPGWPYYSNRINADLSRRLHGWLIAGRRHIESGKDTPESRLVVLIDRRQMRLANIQPAMAEMLAILERATARVVRGKVHDGATDYVGADPRSYHAWDGSITDYGFSVRWTRLTYFSVRWRVDDDHVFTPSNIRCVAHLTLDKCVTEFRRLAEVLENSIIREEGDAQVIAFPSSRIHHVLQEVGRLSNPAASGDCANGNAFGMTEKEEDGR